MRTSVQLVRDVDECQSQYNHLRTVFVQQNNTLRLYEFRVLELEATAKATQAKTDSLLTQDLELIQEIEDHRQQQKGRADRNEKKTKRRNRWLWITGTLAAVEAAYIILQSQLK